MSTAIALWSNETSSLVESSSHEINSASFIKSSFVTFRIFILYVFDLFIIIIHILDVLIVLVSAHASFILNH